MALTPGICPCFFFNISKKIVLNLNKKKWNKRKYKKKKEKKVTEKIRTKKLTLNRDRQHKATNNFGHTL